jgi:hypothetical protein
LDPGTWYTRLNATGHITRFSYQVLNVPAAQGSLLQSTSNSFSGINVFPEFVYLSFEYTTYNQGDLLLLTLTSSFTATTPLLVEVSYVDDCAQQQSTVVTFGSGQMYLFLNTATYFGHQIFGVRVVGQQNNLFLLNAQLDAATSKCR